MKNKIYFIGNEELRERLAESLLLIGCTLDQLRNWDTGQTVIYQLENIDELSCHIPDNLLIVTKNTGLKESIPESVFKYDETCDMGFSFARFILERIKQRKDSPSDFYDNREKVAILCLSPHKELEKLMNFLERDRHFLFQKKVYNRSRTKLPQRTLIYLEAPEMPSFLDHGLPLVCRGYNMTQKKELKKNYPSVHIIFINNVSLSSSRKVRRLLF